MSEERYRLERELAEARGALQWMAERDDRNGSLPEAYLAKINEALAAVGSEPLCEDEGCDHHGTPHVCRNVRERAAEHLSAALEGELDGLCVEMDKARTIMDFVFAGIFGSVPDGGILSAVKEPEGRAAA